MHEFAHVCKNACMDRFGEGTWKETECGQWKETGRQCTCEVYKGLALVDTGPISYANW